ncbi:DUF2357 domain-containing protein [Paenibacillus macerans]|uniref:DUF2357 domain-containing protein n=1 Tax=Paenibacillus macerans TaxID=44252 RepID=UPI002432BD21|nr:DUF2357 domain-containing protein [Paenibacillus macerans]
MRLQSMIGSLPLEKRWEPFPTLRFCGLPLTPNQAGEYEVSGQFTTPFHSGLVQFELGGMEVETYIYPDSRKMTQEQYDLMLSDILQEASLVFEVSHIETEIDAEQRFRELSLAQWSYIEASFAALSNLIWHMTKQPMRVLHATERYVRRDQVRNVDPGLWFGLEQNWGQSTIGTIPETVWSTARADSYNTYETTPGDYPGNPSVPETSDLPAVLSMVQSLA